MEYGSPSMVLTPYPFPSADGVIGAHVVDGFPQVVPAVDAADRKAIRGSLLLYIS